ncbi:MAG: PAS domain S-box protein [Bdellovibrionaceae bacterium]|nr:PAS domain S-box protein [Pseudobdellovibrionaceae bacterium]
MNLRKTSDLSAVSAIYENDFQNSFSNMLNISPIGFVLVRKNYRIQQVNATFARWFNTSTESFIDRVLPELFSDLWLYMEPQCQRAIRGDGTTNQELRYARNSASLLTWLVSYTPILEKEEIQGFALAITDISDRKEMELHRQKEMERSSQLYNALSRVNQSIASSRGRDDLFEKVTRALIEQGGFPMAWVGWYSAETSSLIPVSSMSFKEIKKSSLKINLDDPKKMSPTLIAFTTDRPYICNDILNDSHVTAWREEFKNPGFKSSASFPIRENGRTAGVLSVYAHEPNFFKDKEVSLLAEATQDLSVALENFALGNARLKAESSALEERAFSDTMIESMPGILYFYDENGKFLRWNKNMEKVSGYSGREISQMHPLDFFAPNEQALLKERIALVFQNGESSLEANFMTKAGKLIPYFFTGKKLVHGGLPCLVGIGVDVTDRKRAEQALKDLNESLELKVISRTKELQAALVRAESADRLKSAFLATMSHELRTPLNSIIGFTGIVLQKLAGPLTDEQTKQLNMVRGSARHLLDLINDILDLSKIEAKQLEIKSAEFDLRGTIEKTIELMKPTAEKKSLPLITEIAPDISTWISDSRRVKQILLNLVNNAVKFTEQGQVMIIVDMMTSYLPPMSMLPQTAIRIRVKDTGIGIKPEHLSLLFQPFRQVDSGLSRQHEGTGLGLAICQRLTSLLGGEISVNSVWNKGTEFTVILPKKEPAFV